MKFLTVVFAMCFFALTARAGDIVSEEQLGMMPSIICKERHSGKKCGMLMSKYIASAYVSKNSDSFMPVLTRLIGEGNTPYQAKLKLIDRVADYWISNYALPEPNVI
jgi:hypothetical protein